MNPLDKKLKQKKKLQQSQIDDGIQGIRIKILDFAEKHIIWLIIVAVIFVLCFLCCLGYFWLEAVTDNKERLSDWKALGFFFVGFLTRFVRINKTK
jgi:hypothetical protein